MTSLKQTYTFKRIHNPLQLSEILKKSKKKNIVLHDIQLVNGAPVVFFGIKTQKKTQLIIHQILYCISIGEINNKKHSKLYKLIIN